jgi:hypothetical protein
MGFGALELAGMGEPEGNNRVFAGDRFIVLRLDEFICGTDSLWVGAVMKEAEFVGVCGIAEVFDRDELVNAGISRPST